jgi:hypothetical protein
VAGEKQECIELAPLAEAEVSLLGLRTSLLALDTLLRLSSATAGFPAEEAAQDARLLARRMNTATLDMQTVLAKVG